MPSDRSERGKPEFMIRSAKAFVLAGALTAVSFAQNAPASNQSSASPADSSKSAAYYNFAMGRLYALMAQAEGFTSR